ncbi:plastocyanin/azurin family copper-binding protein [Variovorax sp. 38R]|uniref:cupredoxin domain-containing protein n=1 Tax=Variovorax sp. 38R TaxID=2774875 RepID=UPI001786FAC0|nr:cupredoxin family protein [Variovorax sp. 38R]QOF76881.1 cupredoxin family protein [Variovorax sp. 38R]
MNTRFSTLVAGLALAAVSTFATAHESHAPKARTAAAPTLAPEQKAWGIAGKASAVKRTIDIAMADDMTFTPSVLEVREGDTIRLRLKNRGKDLHELVLGTAAVIEDHAAMMKKHPGMEHDEPWMAHVQPGKTGELIWTFNRAGDFDFACLVKDHYELGMAGRVRVLAAAAPSK